MHRFIRLLILALLPALLGAGADSPPASLSPRARLALEVAAARADRPAAPVTQAGEAAHPAPAAPVTGSGRAAHPARANLAPGTVLQVLIDTDDPAALAAAGFELRTVAGTVATAGVPLGRLTELAAVPGVRRVDLSLPVRFDLDVSVPEIRADEVHRAAAPPYPADGITGRGVVLGVIDTGIDITHPDFQDETGATRIDRIWDQRDSAGPSPAPFGYGTEWTAADIDAGLCRQRDDVGHGTHVAGIAAGNGRGTDSPEDLYRYVGVAPEADIIAVKAELSEARIIDAVSWIFDRAGDRPCVINMSIGSQTGPHDGTTALDRALAALTGPGRLLVAAAGNEGGSEIHAGADLAPGETVDIEIGIYPYFPLAGAANDYLELEAWYPGDSAIEFSFVSPNEETAGPSTPNGERSWTTLDGTVYVDHRRDPINGDYLALIDIYDEIEDQAPAAGLWTVRARNTSAEDTRLDLWVSFDALGAIGANVFVADGMENAMLVDSPASSDSVLAVGAYVTKYQWAASDGKVYQYEGSGEDVVLGRIAPFSSPGPRRDGVVKPDIAAPGMGIVAARSTVGRPDFTDVRLTTPDGMHVISQGTSQASPHAAGVAALVLQKHPGVAMRDLFARVHSSGRVDPFTGPVPNGSFGYGRIDAVASVYPPILITALTAAWEAGDVAIRWTVSLPAPEALFVVERSHAATGPFHAVSGELAGEDVFVWIDPDPEETQPWYRVRAVAADETTSFFGPVKLAPLVDRVRLWQNAPNPVRDLTVVSFDLDREQEVRLDLFDVSGRRLALLHEGPLPAGRHDIGWDRRDSRGRRVAAGLYFYRLTTPGSVLFRRLVVLP